MAVDTATSALVCDEYCTSCGEITAHDRVESVRDATNGLRWLVAFCQECNAEITLCRSIIAITRTKRRAAREKR